MGDIAAQVKTSVSSLLLSRPDLCGIQDEDDVRATDSQEHTYREVRSKPPAHVRQIIKTKKPMRFVTEHRAGFRAAAQAVAGSLRLNSVMQSLPPSGHSQVEAQCLADEGESVSGKDIGVGPRDEPVDAARKGGGVDMGKIAEVLGGRKTAGDLSAKFVGMLKAGASRAGVGEGGGWGRCGGQ